LGDDFELRLGGEWRRAIGETKENFTFVAGAPTRLRTAGGKSDSYGAFAELSVEPMDGVTLSAGGRLDRWQIENGFRREVNIGGTVRSDDRFVDRAGTEETARLGAAYNFEDDWLIKASAYTAWRLPTLNELYRPFRVGADATAANEELRPERIKGVEAGLSYNPSSYFGGRGTFGNLTLFYNRLDNAIANVTLGQGAGVFPGVGFVAAGGAYRQRQNLEAIVSKGVELDGRIAVVDGLGLTFGFAYVDSKVKGRGAALALDGLRPAQVPKHFAGAGFDYREDQGPWQAAFNLRYVGRQFDDDANTRRLKEALTADFMVHYEFADDWGLELRAENIFDARIEAAISGNGIIERALPRTLWLGLRREFH
jgi:outer membrane receptor protein involved in Fe transport